MSRKRVEWLRQGYEAFNASKQASVRGLTSDVMLVEPDDDVLGEGVSRGHEAWIRHLRKWTDTWDEFRIEPEKFFDSGDRTLVFVRLRGRAHASGVPLDESAAHVFTFRGKEIAALHIYRDRDQALEAVGLSE
jgi:ketosteroid isomerase-like protein